MYKRQVVYFAVYSLCGGYIRSSQGNGQHKGGAGSCPLSDGDSLGGLLFVLHSGIIVVNFSVQTTPVVVYYLSLIHILWISVVVFLVSVCCLGIAYAIVLKNGMFHESLLMACLLYTSRCV